MQFKPFSYFFLFAILPPTFAQDFGPCKATNGVPGECIKTSACKTQGGISDPAHLCPGDNTIQVISFTGLLARDLYRKHH